MGALNFSTVCWKSLLRFEKKNPSIGRSPLKKIVNIMIVWSENNFIAFLKFIITIFSNHNCEKKIKLLRFETGRTVEHLKDELKKIISKECLFSFQIYISMNTKNCKRFVVFIKYLFFLFHFIFRSAERHHDYSINRISCLIPELINTHEVG